MAQNADKPTGLEIPLSTPSSSREEGPREVGQGFLERLDVDAELRAARDAASGEYRRALNTHVERLSPGNGIAERLAFRHNRLCMGKDFILATALMGGDSELLETLSRDDPDTSLKMEVAMGVSALPVGAACALHHMSRVASKEGFFLIDYPVEQMERNLQDPLWIVAEASGAHPCDEQGRVAPVADYHCHLPSADGNELPSIELPVEIAGDDGDHIFCDTVLRQLREAPWRVAMGEDITCDKEHSLSGLPMSNLGLAGMARRKVLHEIETEINPQRWGHEIRFMGAAIAVVQGMTLPSGEEILLTDLCESTIKNDRSILVHEEGRNPAKLAWKLVNRRVPVQIGSETYHVIVNWLYYFHDLKDFNPEARAAVWERDHASN